jgi:ankyrin repeat protein
MISRSEVDAVLQSTSDSLFPADLGARKVAIDSRGADGDTPLHVLIWRGDRRGALCLIACGAPLDAPGDMAETPLHLALRRGDRVLIDALLQAGAATDRVSEWGETAVQLAARKGLSLQINGRPDNDVAGEDA